MIVVLTDDSFYLLEMNESDFMTIIFNKNSSITNIRAKSTMHFLKNDASKFLGLLENRVSEITTCFCAYGDNKYSMKSVNNIEDLRYYKATDGNLYTCFEAYEIENSSKKVEQLDKDNISTLNRDNLRETVLEESTVDSATKLKDGETSVSNDLSEETDTFISTTLSPELKEKSLTLDTVLKRLPHIRDYFSTYLNTIREYIDRNKTDFRKTVTQSFLEDIALESTFDESTTNGIVLDNALGSSNDLLDSLVNLPVYNRVINANNLPVRFSQTNLNNSKYIRICPIGINENGDLLGTVDVTDISDKEVEIISLKAKSKLTEDGKKFNQLNNSQKYIEWENEAANYFKNKKATKDRKSKPIEVIKTAIDNLKKQGYYIIDDFNKNGIPPWSSYERITLDNRVIEGSSPKPIVTQLEEKYISGKNPKIENNEDKSTVSDDIDVQADISRIINKIISERSTTEQKAKATNENVDKAPKANISKLIVDMASFVPTGKPTKVNSYTEDGIMITSDSINKLKERTNSESAVQPGRTISDTMAQTLLKNVVSAVTINGVDPLNPANNKKAVRKR